MSIPHVFAAPAVDGRRPARLSLLSFGAPLVSLLVSSGTTRYLLIPRGTVSRVALHASAICSDLGFGWLGSPPFRLSLTGSRIPGRRLTSNLLGDAGALALGEVLKTNAKLSTLKCVIACALYW